MLEAVVFALVTTHISSACMSLYLHRCLSHRHFVPSKGLEHFFRVWLWLTDGVRSKPWVAQHRVHHMFTDKEGDPHSPVLFGFWTVTYWCLIPNFIRPYQYRESDWELNHYGKGTPDDWLEHNVYAKYQRLGVLIMLAIDLLLFGWLGLAVWVFQLFWVPFWSNAAVTGGSHWLGYRRYNTKDNSRNLWPIGIMSGGEELHHNHHAYPNNPNLRHKWYEFDIGWIYIKLFEKLGLLTLKK